MKNEFNQLHEVVTLSLQEAKNSISQDVQKELEIKQKCENIF
jgi:hypothetical protein